MLALMKLIRMLRNRHAQFDFESMIIFAGPTDLSMKNPPKPALLSHKLNTMELNAVKTLISGYRESAAFLLRSADELEQLLLHQP